MIREATRQDVNSLADLAIIMWDNHTLEDLRAEFEDDITKDNAVFFSCIL